MRQLSKNNIETRKFMINKTVESVSMHGLDEDLLIKFTDGTAIAFDLDLECDQLISYSLIPYLIS